MNLLPVAERELRVGARRRGTYWIRFHAALVAIAVATLVFLGTLRESPVQQAELLFSLLSSLAFSYCLLAGALATCDCISEEKREGTLGLLFLTPLRGYDVVAGKLAASSFRAVSGLVAILPVLVLPVLMGSISAERIRDTAAVLVNTLFLSLAIGVLVSVLARDPRQAVGGASLALFTWVALLPLVRWMFVDYILVRALGWVQRDDAWQSLRWVLAVNPIVLFAWSGPFTGVPLSGSAFWIGLAVQHALAWLAILAACLLVSRCWQDRVHDRGGELAVSRDVRPGAKGSAERRRELTAVASHTGIPADHPFAWLVLREHRAMRNTWWGLGLIGVVWGWGLWELNDDWLHLVVGFATFFVASVWLKIRWAAMACRPFHEHRRTGALELVLCTAQTPESLVDGMSEGLRRLFLAPLLVVNAMGLLLFGLGIPRGPALEDATQMGFSFLAVAGMLWLDLRTLSWIGMWRGMSMSRYVRAWGSAVGWVMSLPWCLYLGGLMVAGIVASLLELGVQFDPGYQTLLASWLVVSVAVDASLIAYSRRQLRSRFRELAQAHYGPEGKPS